MKYLITSIAICLVPATLLSAPSWDREEFLGPLAHSPKVESYVRTARQDRNFVAKLEQFRSPEATTALLRIAYSEGQDQFGPLTRKEAAQRFLQSSQSKDSARALLAASDPEIIDIGLVALIHEEIDPSLLARLGELAQSPSCMVRSKVAFVFRDAPNTSINSINQEKAEILLKSMPSVLACDDATNTLSFGDNVFYLQQTYAEFALRMQAFALGTATNLTSEFWARQELPTGGHARDFMVLGRVMAGDKTSRAEARTILKNSESVPARRTAMIALMRNPQEEDIAAVRWVAEHDTFRALAMGGYFNMPGSDKSIQYKRDSERQVYMLRFLAAHELRMKGFEVNTAR